MTTVNKRTSRLVRAALATVAVAAVGAVAGCSNLLDVQNPGAIDAVNINDPYYITQMTNGVVGEFQLTHGQVVMYSSVLGDEMANAHVYSENQWIDQRNVGVGNGTFAGAVYGGLHRARFLADSVAGRLKTLLADSAGRDLRLARVLAYGGYAYVFLGEQFCGTPINVSAMKTDDEVLAMAPPRFDQAITVALAAKAWASSHAVDATYTQAALTAIVNGSDSIANFARVGAARAYLDLNNKAQAIVYASAVTPVWTSDASTTTRGFQFWGQWLDGTFQNPMWAATATTAGSGSRSLSLYGTPYAYIVDPRVPTYRGAVMDGSWDGLDPVPTLHTTMEILSTSSYSTWTNSTTGVEIAKSASIRIASAIEAKYILAEAQGPTQTNVDFINSRRALTQKGGPLIAPGTTLTTGTDATTFRNAVIEQRTLDLFADGHRIGDLRRYKKYYSLNFWPTGTIPGSATSQQYGTDECWPIPTTETNTNPNLLK